MDENERSEALQDFEKQFRDEMKDHLGKLEGLSPEVRAGTENEMKRRFLQHQKDTGEMRAWLHFGIDALAQRAQKIQHAKDNGLDIEEIEAGELKEGQYYQEAIRIALRDVLGKINDLPDDQRIETWTKLKDRFRQHVEEYAKREGEFPNYNDPKTKDKHPDLVKSLNHDADQIAGKALETQHARDLAGESKARGHGASRENDRER